MDAERVELESEITERITYTIPPSRMEGPFYPYKSLAKPTSSDGTALGRGANGSQSSSISSQGYRMQAASQKVEWNVNSSKESAKENVATFSPVKSLNRLVSLLQICAVSFFALNQDLTLKLGYSLAWLIFIIIGIAIETPCLFNCYIDPSTLTRAPLTPDFLAILGDFITLIHAIVAGMTALAIGGDLRRFGYFFTLVSSASSSSLRSSQRLTKFYWTLKVYIIFFGILALAAFQCFLLAQFNSRRIFRPYTPDKLKLSNAKEGSSPYIWEYKPTVDVDENFFMYASLLFRGFLVIHVRSLEVITIHLSQILKAGNFLAIVNNKDTPDDNEMDAEETGENNQRQMVLYLSKVLDRIVFKSLLFNLLTILTSIAIVTRLMTTVYLIPSTYYYDLMKLFEAIFFIIWILSSCSQIHLQVTLLSSKLKASFPTGSQMGALLLLVLSYALFICMVAENTQNPVIHTAYYFDEFSDWFSELKKKIDNITIYQNEFDEKAKAGIYLTPEYFAEKIEQSWDEAEKKQFNSIRLALG